MSTIIIEDETTIVEVEDKTTTIIEDGGRGPQGFPGADGTDGANIELQTTATHIQWRVVGAATWTNLIALADLQGADGDPASNLVTSVAGRQGDVILTKSDVALSNVDNTSDANKPISTATQTALNLKVDKVAGERLINAAEITKLGNQSGTNTGDQDLSGLAVKANNLSDLTNAATARTNLGLGTLATQNGTFSGTSSGTNTGDQNDHGLMAGLGDDDHTQYMLLSGRVGGQTLFDRLSLSVPTLTGSSATSALSISQTYNTTGTPTFFDLNLTDTASNAASLFVNCRLNGVSQLSISKFGQFNVANNPAIFHGSGVFGVTHSGVQHIRSNNTGTTIGTGGLFASARLAVVSTTQGFLPPVMTATQGSAIASPAEGLMIYVNNTNGTFPVKGWYGYNGAAWERLNN